ncbi:MAG: DUF2905 family protein [candidate division WOR-3 bacterium]|nr:DUF2905 family protein [candidate division WOR-3 bacterium]
MLNIGRLFIIFGLIFIITGIFLLIFPRIQVFKLPGDIVIKKDNFFFYFPIVSSLLLSIILSLFLNLFLRK